MNKEQMIEVRDSFVASNNNKIPTAMTVDRVICRLEEMDSEMYILIDFGGRGMFSDFRTDSWRGSYEYPAVFKTNEPFTVEECLGNLRLTDGKEVTGYKGGHFVLRDNYELYVETEAGACSSTAIIDIVQTSEFVLVKTMANMY